MIRFAYWRAIGLLLTATACVPAWANLMGATSAPKQATISVEDGRTIHIRWTISSSPAHSSGVFSAQATLKDSATDTLLKTIEHPLNRTDGAGPFQFEETLTLSPDEVKQWYNLGYNKLVFKRAFTTGTSGAEAASSAEASLWLTLFNKQSNGNAARTNNLVVHGLNLRFKPQRFNQRVLQNLPLQAQLALAHSGEGTLNAMWQIAELSNEGNAVFKDLASANKFLKHQQPGYLLSPKLPTSKPGRYVLRVCVNDHNTITNQVHAGQNQCANPETSANLQYEVVEALPPEPNSEPEITTLPASASFAWPATPGATVYELRLKQTTQKQMVHSSQFVARMLLPYDTQTTVLSSEIVEHMHPGTEYEWQVFALDHHGDVIHQTQPQYFVFMP